MIEAKKGKFVYSISKQSPDLTVNRILVYKNCLICRIFFTIENTHSQNQNRLKSQDTSPDFGYIMQNCTTKL